MLAISFNFLNTPPAVRLAGWNIMRWLLRELSATRPKSPFSCASALILSNCRPGNKSETINSSRLAGWWAENAGISSSAGNAQASIWVQQNVNVCACVCAHVCKRVYYQLLEQQLSLALSLQCQAPSPGRLDPAGSNTGTHSTAGHLEKTTHSHILSHRTYQHTLKQTGLQREACKKLTKAHSNTVIGESEQ